MRPENGEGLLLLHLPVGLREPSPRPVAFKGYVVAEVSLSRLIKHRACILDL